MLAEAAMAFISLRSSSLSIDDHDTPDHETFPQGRTN